MRKIKIVFLATFFIGSIAAQKSDSVLAFQSNLVDRITDNEDWKNILDFATSGLTIESQDAISDISKTIEFQKKITGSDAIDMFFYTICDSTILGGFPYRSSGQLADDLYTPIDTTQGYIYREPSIRGILSPIFFEIINTEREELIPRLIEFLRNDAATRLCVKPYDSDDWPFYLSISDVAMELIEIKTYCDFYDNTRMSENLFSNLSAEAKSEIIAEIEKWYVETKQLTTYQRVEFFLDSICDYGKSYKYTCHNLLFIKDTIGAQKHYGKYYEEKQTYCKADFEIGKILLKLGDRRVLDDCITKVYNYKCEADGSKSYGRNCIFILLESDEAYYRDEVFAEIIATEPQSIYRRANSKTSIKEDFIWHTIFWNLIYNKYSKLPITLIELMKIQDGGSTLTNQITQALEKNYPEEFIANYRVCDYALLFYNETVEPLVLENWNDVEERNKIIGELIIKSRD